MNLESRIARLEASISAPVPASPESSRLARFMAADPLPNDLAEVGPAYAVAAAAALAEISASATLPPEQRPQVIRSARLLVEFARTEAAAGRCSADDADRVKWCGDRAERNLAHAG